MKLIICITICLFLMIFAVEAKPQCTAPSDCYRVPLAVGQECNLVGCIQGGCYIDECHSATSDPCWGMACENGHFNNTKWNLLIEEWKEERWNAFLQRYNYNLRDGCTSKELKCVAITRTFQFEQTDNVPMKCCVPICEKWNHEEEFGALMSEGFSSMCDFSEGGAGYMNFTPYSKPVIHSEEPVQSETLTSIQYVESSLELNTTELNN